MTPQSLRTSGRRGTQAYRVLWCRFCARLKGWGSEIQVQPTCTTPDSLPKGGQTHQDLLINPEIRWQMIAPFPILFSWFFSGHLGNTDFAMNHLHSLNMHHDLIWRKILSFLKSTLWTKLRRIHMRKYFSSCEDSHSLPPF